jgi:hypothetical protein
MSSLVKIIVLSNNSTYIYDFLNTLKLVSYSNKKDNIRLEIYYQENMLFKSKNYSLCKVLESKNIYFFDYKNNKILPHNIENLFIEIQPTIVVC